MRPVRHRFTAPWLAAIAAGLGATGCNRADPNQYLAHGTVEVRQVDVAPLAAGRVLRVMVDEGDQVRAGDTIAVLDAPTLEADLMAARARVAASEAALADLNAGPRQPELAIARAELAAARTDSARLANEATRVEALHRAGAVAAREHEQAAAAAAVAADRVRAAGESLRLLEAGTRSDRIAAARAEVSQSRAALQGREAISSEFVLTAPLDGVVLVRVADPGDLLAIGAAAVVLGVTDQPWARVYLPARLLARVSVGDTVTVHPVGDTASTVAGSGRIVAINPQAEYVTRVALTVEERADLLFGVRVAIDPPVDRFKPGLPVTVQITPRNGTP